MKTVIVGSGSWGTALGLLLARNGAPTTLLCRSAEIADAINHTHQNPSYLPDTRLPDNLNATTEASSALPETELVLFVVPTAHLRQVAESLSPFIGPEAILLSCAKGIERGTGKRMSQILADVLPGRQLAVLSGPNHAEEIAQGLPACAVLGADSAPLATMLQELFISPSFRTYSSTDIAGIELGGAIKNVYAIASGVASGLKLGDNATAALVTRSLAEMTRLGMALGGQAETFAGLSGVGDLIATCFSHHSRNFRTGLAIASGQTAEEAQKKLGMVAEGVPNTLSIFETSRDIGARTPLIDAVYSILYKNQPAHEVLHELLTRDPRPEAE
ncbi:MAG: NAD(P)H-dependent glycerol-3-phosphate dehydrogenase [Verrucomicrobiota bacterium JB023]|nr:NAD(P)H-dependent glycerol-3-phosphate dehydrogenase [Verrucomicrobiota bacterium JB023]